MAKTTINGIDELKTRVGDELGVSDWRDVTQADIDAFAEVTGDDQWIHVDPSARRTRRSAGRSPTATSPSRSHRSSPTSSSR
jgi:acyl dehydratase